ncbi:hypothetical protein [Microbacterium sp.]|uniref:hypothetical protein n=1 Tax=Microbacterium sp. TaxID=51671 RepID=UPI003A91E764
MQRRTLRRSLVAASVAIATAVASISVGGLPPAEAVVITATASSAPLAAARHGTAEVQVTTPGEGSVVVADTKAAAAGARVKAQVKLSGPVTSVTVTLNGHPVPTHGHGTQNLTLDAAHGLRVGANEMFVSATVTGSSTPAQAVDRFVVGYPVTDLLTTSGLKLGSGDAAAATLGLQGPVEGVNQTTATLNGKAVTLPDARRTADGKRLIDLNLAHLGALKRGKNTFDLQLAMNDGRVQTVHRSFTLAKKRDIAVANVSGSTTVGRLITLDASDSQAAHGKLAARWTLLHQPDGSHARLTAGSGTTTTVTPDLPGTYVVALRTGSGSTAGYDVSQVQVTNAEPTVPFNTLAVSGGKKGLQVGSAFYGYDTNPIQMIVLDRYTLAKIVWHSYDAKVGQINQMMTDWTNEKLTADDLVMVTTTATISDDDALGDLDKALQRIGGNIPGNYVFNNPGCWQGYTFACTKYDSGQNNTWTLNQRDGNPLSVIGVYGMPAGQAWRATDESTPASSLTGYLTKGVTTQSGLADQYVVVNGQTGDDGTFDGYQTIDTCANVNGATCAVTVGGHVYASPKANGIHVVVLRRNDLAAVSNTTVTTTAELHAAINTSTTGAPYGDQKDIHYVTAGGQSDTRVVIVQTVGDGKVTGTPSAYIWQDLSQLGGTPEALRDSIDGSHPYALVGVADNLPWRGTALESSTVMAVGSAPGQPTGHINGVLHRDRTGQYAPTTGSPAGSINAELYGILYQPTQGWPYAGDLALKYIADNIGLSGYPDVRSAYPNEGTDFGTKAALLTNLTCTDVGQCGSNFAAVKQQLLTEFDWVMSVRGFINAVRAPYVQNGSGAIFAVDKIYDDVMNSVPPPSKNTSLSWFDTVKQVVGIEAAIGLPGAAEAGKALSLVGTVMDITNEIMDSGKGSSTGQVVADSADKLSAQLAMQQSATVEGIDRIETMLVSDYGKLAGVGAKAGGNDPSWMMTSDMTVDAIDALNASTRAQSYTTLIPETWAATDLTPSPKGGNESVTNDVTKYRCQNIAPDVNTGGGGTPSYPFKKALPANQFQANSRVESDGSIMTDVWTFTQHVGSGTVVPNTSLTDKIYGPASRGADGAYQYGPSWWRSTFNPPSGLVCYPPNGVADVWNTPPNIPLPLP